MTRAGLTSTIKRLMPQANRRSSEKALDIDWDVEPEWEVVDADMRPEIVRPTGATELVEVSRPAVSMTIYPLT